MSLVWQDPESRAKSKPLAECPLFESGLSAPLPLGAQCETGVQHIKAGSPLAAPDIAHARNSDPKHSHEAAKSVRMENLGRTRDGILDVLKVNGPQTDEQIWATYSRWYDLGRTVPRSSPSGLRSRRSELVRMGFVVEAGTGKTASGRPCAIWRLA